MLCCEMGEVRLWYCWYGYGGGMGNGVGIGE